MILTELQTLYAQLLAARDAYKELANMKQPDQPTAPKVFHTQADIDYYGDALYQWQVKIADHRRSIAAAEAAEREAKRNLMQALPPQSWIASGIKDVWIGKQTNDWPMDDGTLHVVNTPDPDTLPELKFQHISSN